MKNLLIIIAAIVLLGGASIYFLSDKTSYEADLEMTETETGEAATQPDVDTAEAPAATETDDRPDQEIIGTSVNGNNITAYHFGEGEKEVLFVGGIHGGYSFNTSLVAFELIDYLEANENTLPSDITVTVVPIMNPDGLQSVTGKLGRFSAADVSATESQQIAGRFNTNDVDLNRNFDCDWSKTSSWRNETVSGGSAPESETEAKAISNYLANNPIAGAVVWFAAEGKVYPSACEASPSQASVELAANFATAAGYGTAAEFDAYTINGDMVNWMAKEDIPAISVLLSDHENAEWDKNKAGAEAVIDYISTL